MTPAIAYLKLEITRMDAYGAALGLKGDFFAVPVLYLLLSPLVLTKVMDFSTLLVLVAVLGGLMFGLNLLLPWFFEYKSAHRQIDGLLPVSRIHQVAGRYLLFAVEAVMLTVGLCIIWLLTIASGYQLSFAGDLLPALAIGLVFMLVVGSVMMPFFYRFGFVKGGRILLIGLAAFLAFCGGVMGFISGLAEAPIIYGIRKVAEAVTAQFPPIALLLAGSIAMVAVSYLISRRIWTREDL